MGNYLSCTLAKAPGPRPGGKRARVILPDDGGVRQVALPATAAELMMDAPRPRPADEELQLGAVYATFPMKRLGTPLAAPDLARLAAAAAREAHRSAKVASAAVVAAPPPEDAPRLRLEEMVDDAAAAEIAVTKHRASGARSRRPTLETIDEESYLSSR